ncbi:unnamed protein product, partial [Prorocentrum cordatum]
MEAVIEAEEEFHRIKVQHQEQLRQLEQAGVKRRPEQADADGAADGGPQWKRICPGPAPQPDPPGGAEAGPVSAAAPGSAPATPAAAAKGAGTGRADIGAAEDGNTRAKGHRGEIIDAEGRDVAGVAEHQLRKTVRVRDVSDIAVLIANLHQVRFAVAFVYLECSSDFYVAPAEFNATFWPRALDAQVAAAETASAACVPAEGATRCIDCALISKGELCGHFAGALGLGLRRSVGIPVAEREKDLGRSLPPKFMHLSTGGAVSSPPWAGVERKVRALWAEVHADETLGWSGPVGASGCARHVKGPGRSTVDTPKLDPAEEEEGGLDLEDIDPFVDVGGAEQLSHLRVSRAYAKEEQSTEAHAAIVDGAHEGVGQSDRDAEKEGQTDASSKSPSMPGAKGPEAGKKENKHTQQQAQARLQLKRRLRDPVEPPVEEEARAMYEQLIAAFTSIADGACVDPDTIQLATKTAYIHWIDDATSGSAQMAHARAEATERGHLEDIPEHEGQIVTHPQWLVVLWTEAWERTWTRDAQEARVIQATLAKLRKAALSHDRALEPLRQLVIGSIVQHLKRNAGPMAQNGGELQSYVQWGSRASTPVISTWSTAAAGFWDTTVAGSSALGVAVQRRLRAGAAVQMGLHAAGIYYDAANLYDNIGLGQLIDKAGDMNCPMLRLIMVIQMYFAPMAIMARGLFSDVSEPANGMVAVGGQALDLIRPLFYGVLDAARQRYLFVALQQYLGDLALQVDGARRAVVDRIRRGAGIFHAGFAKLPDPTSSKTAVVDSDLELQEEVASVLASLGTPRRQPGAVRDLGVDVGLGRKLARPAHSTRRAVAGQGIAELKGLRRVQEAMARAIADQVNQFLLAIVERPTELKRCQRGWQMIYVLAISPLENIKLAAQLDKDGKFSGSADIAKHIMRTRGVHGFMIGYAGMQ